MNDISILCEEPFGNYERREYRASSLGIIGAFGAMVNMYDKYMKNIRISDGNPKPQYRNHNAYAPKSNTLIHKSRQYYRRMMRK